MLIIISLAMALFMGLAAKGCALLMNAKFSANIRSEYFHLFINTFIICITIYFVPKLTVCLGYQP